MATTIAGSDLGKSADQFHTRAKQQIEDFNDCVRIYEERLQADHLIIDVVAASKKLLQLPIWFRASQMYVHCSCCMLTSRYVTLPDVWDCCCCCFYLEVGVRMIGTGSQWLDGVDWPSVCTYCS